MGNYLLLNRQAVKLTGTSHLPFRPQNSKGGTSDIENLGICCKEANMAKNELTVEELLDLCKSIVQYNTKRKRPEVA